MHKFTDAKVQEWEISLNVAVMKQIRDALGVDLHSITQGDMVKLVTNPETLVDVISVICTSQIKKRDLDEYGFAECMVGDALDYAYDALINELVFITPRSRREVVGTAWKKVNDAQEKMTAAQKGMLESPILEEKITGMIQEMQDKFASL